MPSLLSKALSLIAVSSTTALLTLPSYASANEEDIEETVTPTTLFDGMDHLNIYLNHQVDNLYGVMEDSDRLSLLYIFDSNISTDSSGQDWRILDQMFLKVMEELKGGYVDMYAVDCAAKHSEYDSRINFKYFCEDRDEFQPTFTLYKPPELKKNPYTGKPMALTPIGFPSNQISDPDVKKWITDNVPDFT